MIYTERQIRDIIANRQAIPNRVYNEDNGNVYIGNNNKQLTRQWYSKNVIDFDSSVEQIINQEIINVPFILENYVVTYDTTYSISSGTTTLEIRTLSSGDFTLPKATGGNFKINIKNNSAFVQYLQSFAGDTIDSSSLNLAIYPKESYTVQSDGVSNCVIISDYEPQEILFGTIWAANTLMNC